MSWIEQVTLGDLKFHVGSLGGWADHGFSLILSQSEISDAGDRLQEITDWFQGDGQEWCLVREWQSTDYDQNYFSYEERLQIYNSQFASDDDKRYCFEHVPKAKSPPKAPKPNPGYVYLIKNNEGHYKIGKSVNPNKRIESLGVVLPFPIEAVHLVYSDRMSKLEKELHERFGDKHIAGEWFALTDEDVNFIKSL